MSVRAAEGIAGDEDLVMPKPSSPSITNKDLDWSIGPQMAILNSTTSTSCLQTPIQSVSSSKDDDDDDKDEDNENQGGDDDTMNVLDGDLETEWSVADLGTYLQLDLGKVKKICSVDASWSEGDEKSVNFVLSVSKDGTTYEDILRSSSSGTTESKEHYNLPTSDGRYLRITFYGDSENNEDVALLELTVNAENQNKKPTTVPGLSREGIPFIRDSQSPINFSNNATNSNEPIIHSAPIVSDIHAMVSPAASFEITLNGSDVDLVDHLTYYITNLPDHGNLTTGTNSASVKYTPFEGYSGLDSFRYKAVDKFGLTSNNATVVMNINFSNQSIAPTATIP